MFDNDHSDAEYARREHDHEMDVQGPIAKGWDRWTGRVTALLIDAGFTSATQGLDGNEYAGAGEPDEGFSIDGASDAFDNGTTPERYVESVRRRRAVLGFI